MDPGIKQTGKYSSDEIGIVYFVESVHHVNENYNETSIQIEEIITFLST